MEKVEIRLPAQLDLASLTALKEELTSAATSANSLIVDGSNVERVGTPAIQLILAAAKAFSGEGRQFTLEAPSQPLSAAFDDLGLAEVTRQWSAC